MLAILEYEQQKYTTLRSHWQKPLSAFRVSLLKDSFLYLTSHCMRKTILPFSQVTALSKSDIAYATLDPRLRPFYAFSPELASLEAVLAQKSTQIYPRADLYAALQKQYQSLPVQEVVQKNIAALQHEHTFTIVTAHQPSLFLGPLYFIYKAISAIVLAETATQNAGGKTQVIPVFVLGAEDHDVEEVNKTWLFGKQIVWNPEETGPVGSMRTESLAAPLAELKGILGDSEAAQALYERVRVAYEKADTFADATQALLHEFLGARGLVVLNMNEPTLKRHFIPIMKEELVKQTSYSLVNQSIEALSELGFKAQATPREINLFYMMPGIRERIVLENGQYQVLNTEYVFTPEEMMAEVEQYPERFSPNVILRPLFQETILPNLGYVGGGGELAYWLERKTQFEHFKLPFPMLIRRHSALWLEQDVVKKLEKLGFTSTEFFEDTDALIRSFVEKNAAVEVNLASEINAVKDLYQQVAEKAKAVDVTLEKAVLAESVKTASGLEQWQGRLIRAEKQKHETTLNQIRGLKEKLFPNGGLQERHDNFLPYYLKYGEGFLEALLDGFEAFEAGFLVLE